MLPVFTSQFLWTNKQSACTTDFFFSHCQNDFLALSKCWQNRDITASGRVGKVSFLMGTVLLPQIHKWLSEVNAECSACRLINSKMNCPSPVVAALFISCSGIDVRYFIAVLTTDSVMLSNNHSSEMQRNWVLLPFRWAAPVMQRNPRWRLCQLSRECPSSSALLNSYSLNTKELSAIVGELLAEHSFKVEGAQTGHTADSCQVITSTFKFLCLLCSWSSLVDLTLDHAQEINQCIWLGFNTSYRRQSCSYS